jgi:hypothetical protein
MRKKRKAFDTAPSSPPCEFEGCLEEGPYKAPKRRGGGCKDYHHFCLEHVRIFNKNYDFFSGMDEDAIIHFRQESLTGHRPTWRSGVQPDLRMMELEAALHHFWHYDAPQPTLNFAVPQAIRDALTLFELQHPVELATVKAQYKMLVKKYHPDINKEKHAEEKFKEITASYHILIEHYHSA